MIIFSHRYILLTTMISMAVSTAVSSAAIDSQLPEQKPLSYYSALWDNSALTRTPKVASQAAQSQLQEWILGGVLDLGDDYMVTLKHKTKPESHRFNLSDAQNNKTTGISLHEVKMNGQNWKETKVAFKDNKGKIHWLAFELTRNKKPTIQKAPTIKAVIKASMENAINPKNSQNTIIEKKSIFFNKPAQHTQSESPTSN